MAVPKSRKVARRPDVEPGVEPGPGIPDPAQRRPCRSVVQGGHPPLPAHQPRRNLLGCLQEGNPATDVFGLPHFLEDCVCFKLIMNFDRVPPVDLLHAI